MKYISYSLLITLCSIILISCNNDDDGAREVVEFNYTFENSKEGWESFFSDYPSEGDANYEFKYERTKLPQPLDQSVDAIMISGNNLSADLFSAIYRKFEGLAPNTIYNVTFDIEVASNISITAIGVGAEPNIALGVGGMNYKPQSDFKTQNPMVNWFRPNFESKLQNWKSNEVFKIIGTVGVSEEIPAPFALANRNNLNDPISLTTNDKGELWLMIATDSGFEGVIPLYYKSIKVRLNYYK